MIVSRKKKRQLRGTPCLVAVAVVAVLFLFWNNPETTTRNSSPLLQLESISNSTNNDESISGLVQAKSVELSKTPKLPGSFPALSSLVKAVPVLQEESKFALTVTGNVQFLLDYAIVGFSKCGTTTLLKWIRRDPEVRTFKREIHEIVLDQHAGSLVERLYHNLLEEEPPISTQSTPTSKEFLQGFKNPEILQVPKALQHLNNHWPETKLIVSVRNPLKWFRSFYNFRLTIGHLEQVGSDPNALIGHCEDGNKMLCSHMGAFHVKLFRMGKTTGMTASTTTKEEMDLIKPFLAPPEYKEDQDILNHIHKSSDRSPTIEIPKMKNKVFFLDLRQMSDTNKTRAKIFRQDLQTFLGLKQELSPVFRARPFKQLEWSLDDESKRFKMDTICNPKYLPLQQELYSMAQNASLWIRNYFLKSEDVVVSSPEYVDELLETWMTNPCDSQEKG